LRTLKDQLNQAHNRKHNSSLMAIKHAYIVNGRAAVGQQTRQREADCASERLLLHAELLAGTATMPEEAFRATHVTDCHDYGKQSEDKADSSFSYANIELIQIKTV